MYEVRLTRQFIRATKKEDLKALHTALLEIAENPFTARGSHTLSHEWAAFRAADFTKTDRIIYRVCEECVRNHQQDVKPLGCCADPAASKQVVTFIDFGNYHASAGRRRLRPASSYDLPSREDEASQ
jgi:mRNA-degrading endonuclease YafQ of YafQ-DinJ toxin-antitoxin module